MPAAVADALGMERILIHPLAGVLSAYGIGIADVKAIRETSWLKPLGEDFSDALAELEAARARRARSSRAFDAERIELAPPRAAAHGRAATRRSRSRSRRPRRCARTSPSLHRQRFGYVGRRCRGHRRCAGRRSDRPRQSRPIGSRAAASRSSAGEVASMGPALIFDPTSTIVVEPGWRAERASDGTLVLTRARAARPRQGDRHRGRSGPARDLQQSVHGDRRGNGGRAAVDRDQRQHQGAARFLLRDLRRRGRADRQRAAHPGASGLDGRKHPDDHRHARRRAGTGAASGAATPMC